MRDEDINKIAGKVLKEHFKGLSFEHSTVKSEEDFDGSSIIRVTAHFKDGEIPTPRLTDALHAIRTELLGRGEERFLLIDSTSPEDEAVDEEEVE